MDAGRLIKSANALSKALFSKNRWGIGMFCAKVGLAASMLIPCVHSQEPSAPVATPEPAQKPVNVTGKNLPSLPTISISGEINWSDLHVEHGWRIQRHAQLDLYRLLDEKGFRRYWGTFEECQSALGDVRRQKNWTAPTGTAVVTLHGLFRSRACMESLGDSLSKDDSWTWVNVGYASTQGSVEDHAESLSCVLEGLDGFDKLHLVCHSLGNLVVRRYVAEADCENPRWKVDPRISRMVMLGPPNQGAALAQFWKGNKLATWVGGPVVQELSPGSELLSTGLAVPKFEFGILAGAYSTNGQGNPLVKGKDDFIVGVEETKLDGAKDFCILPMHHGDLIRNEKSHKYVISFLKDGSFASAADAEKEEAAAATTGSTANTGKATDKSASKGRP